MRLGQSGVLPQKLTTVQEDGKLRRQEAAVVESRGQRVEANMRWQLQQLAKPVTQHHAQLLPGTETRSWLFLVFLASAHRLML